MSGVGQNSRLWREVRKKRSQFKKAHYLEEDQVARLEYPEQVRPTFAGKRGDTRGFKNKHFGKYPQKPCFYCGRALNKSVATVDHVKALSTGGFHKFDNTVIACRWCNYRKGSKTVAEFVYELPRHRREILLQNGI